MDYVSITEDSGVASLTLNRGKVNALNEEVLDQFNTGLDKLEKDDCTRAITLTSEGSFFSFGFDIPELIRLSPDAFTNYLIKFTALYKRIFLFPKPVIAALNGHTIAGGCMLANSCDFRVMVPGKSKISLNEMTFGASVFTGSVEILKFCVGFKNAEKILYTGAMFSAEEALEMNLIDKIVPEENLMAEAINVAQDFAQKDSNSFKSIKGLLRKPIVDLFADKEMGSIKEFVDIWYTDSTMEQLKQIKIRS